MLPGLLLLGLGIGLVMAPSMSLATSGVQAVRRGRGLGDGQHLPAGRRLDRHRAAEHHRRRRRDRASDGPLPLAAVHSYTTAFWCTAAIFAVSAIVTALLLRSGTPAEAPAGEPVFAH